MTSGGADRPIVQLIVAAEYHDASFVRLQLLNLLAEQRKLTVDCDSDFHRLDRLPATGFLITYTSNVFPTEKERSVLASFLENGGRWLAIHGSAACTRFKPPAVNVGGIELPGLTDTPDLEPEYMDLLGCRFISHLAQQPITIRSVSEHPLVAGLPPFTVVDEPYILEIRGECEVLLESRFTGEAPGYVKGPWLKDEPRPQMLLHRHGKGEVVYLALGHACGPYDLQPFIDELPEQPGPWLDATYREVIRRCIAWGTGLDMPQ